MWPRDNVADLIAFYGDPARDDVERQLVKVFPPFRMTYEGRPLKDGYLSFHRLAAPALERALNRVWDYYGRDQAKVDALGISKTAGTYNKRFIAGTTRWSNHAFGAAIDINAEENGFYAVGNIPIPMIAAFKAEGARWGGDYKGRTDPMHFEFCESGEPKRTFEQWLAFYGAPSSGAQQPTGQPMRFTNITATVFGGPSDKQSGTQTAYQTPGDWWNRPGVALPARINTRPLPKVRVTHNGRSVDCDVIDVGPWNKTDAYWLADTRPRAESGQFDDYGRKPTNKAGIDLTPAAAAAIGLPGKGLVDWDFVDHLEATNGDVLDPLPKPTPIPTPAATDTLLPLLLLLLLIPKEKLPVDNEQTTGQAPDLAKVLLPLILQSVISGKPVEAKDLLPVLLQGLLGVQLSLPAPQPAAPPPEPPAAPAAPQSTNDVLMQLLLQLAAGNKSAEQPETKPAPVAPADPTNTGADLWGKIIGLVGAGAAAVAGGTGMAEPSTALVTGIGSLIPLVGGIIGIWNPTVGRMIGGLGGLLHRATAPK